MKNHVIEKAEFDDLKEIIALQKLAYISEAKIINDFSIPPLMQTIDDVRSEFDFQCFLKIKIDDKIMGSVRAYIENGTCHIGKLIVHPDHQNKGLGTKLLTAAENRFSKANRYELFTGEKSRRNLYLYQKLGYKIFKTEIISDKLTLVYLEKFLHGPNHRSY